MNKVKIGDKFVGDGESSFIVLETSSTYTNLEEAKQMTKAAADGGADAIKFQTFFPGESKRILGDPTAQVDFSTPTGKKHELMIDAIARRELTQNEWIELMEYSKNLGLAFISSPYFSNGVDFLFTHGADALKVNKGDVNNSLLIQKMAITNLPIIIDGREKFEDVDKAIKICQDAGNSNIIIMHCPSGYPAESSGIHLRSIPAIKEKYNFPVGFADHSIGGLMDFAAIALGVNMIEKTITPDKTTEQSEHYMSLEPNEIPDFIMDIRSIENAMGNPDILKSSRVSEKMRRSFFTKIDIKIGEQITEEMLDYLRPENKGISCSDGFKVLTKKASKDIPKNTFLQWDMLD